MARATPINIVVALLLARGRQNFQKKQEKFFQQIFGFYRKKQKKKMPHPLTGWGGCAC